MNIVNKQSTNSPKNNRSIRNIDFLSSLQYKPVLVSLENRFFHIDFYFLCSDDLIIFFRLSRNFVKFVVAEGKEIDQTR